jgi:hypothetical protein
MRRFLFSLFYFLMFLSSARVYSQAPSDYSWNTQQASVRPDGNLEWAPQPFVFEPGPSVRYIDYENGDDALDGGTRATAWKHHPWDRNAAARAKEGGGLHTYVFKSGVVYRGGGLSVRESGNADTPIQLTRDPSWGVGAPAFYGSKVIIGGWHRATAEEAPGIPEPEQVWYIDLGMEFDPGPFGSKFAALWQIDGESVERLHIARTPNYDLSDPTHPLANWPSWDRVDGETSTFHSPVLKELHGADAQALRDAVVWATSPSLMGSANPRNMKDATWNTGEGWVRTQAFGNAPTYARHRAWNFFMIENVAQLLDSQGEYFLQRRGDNAGRLYLRPAGGVDPNTVRYEVPVRRLLIDIHNQSHIEISGLEFRFNDPNDGSRADHTRHNIRSSPCIRIVGNGSDILVKNNRFLYVADAVEARLRRVHEGGSAGQVMDRIFIIDNDVRDASGAGIIQILGADFHAIHPSDTEYRKLLHVEVMRNRLINTGFRGSLARWDSLPAIAVHHPETCEIAGNIIDTSFGIGIITHGGKASGHANRTVPLVRYLIHHNQLENTLLGVNDFGGLEHFQGGPAYLYNNVSRNAVGNRSFWNHQLGYNLYLDGGFKCYAFNNILAGFVDSDHKDAYSHCGYFMVFGFLNQFFNNTLYRFEYGIHGSSGNRSQVLGNVLMEASKSFITQNRPGDFSMLGGGDTGEMGRQGIPTMAYDLNVFFGSPEKFGEVAGIVKPGTSSREVHTVSGSNLEDLRAELKAQNSRLAGLGQHIETEPLHDPDIRDYRPSIPADASQRGVTYYIPWALARTVGEWNFYKHETSPEIVLGEHFYMTDELIHRDMYYFLPRNDLTVSLPVTAENYTAGPLEDWIDGALAFDGARIARLSHADITQHIEYPKHKRAPASRYDGSKRESLDMAANNFILEVYFRTEAGHREGTLVSKISDSHGYELSVGGGGRPELTLLANGTKVTIEGSQAVNGGDWQHLLVEVDRAEGEVRFYLDGEAAGKGQLQAIGDEVLSNSADFIVGSDLVGTLDFLRVARSTLAESKTTIEELYAWQFNGPHLRDIRGRSPAANRHRNAGAMISERNAGP